MRSQSLRTTDLCGMSLVVEQRAVRTPHGRLDAGLVIGMCVAVVDPKRTVKRLHDRWLPGPAVSWNPKGMPRNRRGSFEERAGHPQALVRRNSAVPATVPAAVIQRGWAILPGKYKEHFLAVQGSRYSANPAVLVLARAIGSARIRRRKTWAEHGHGRWLACEVR